VKNTATKPAEAQHALAVSMRNEDLGNLVWLGGPSREVAALGPDEVIPALFARGAPAGVLQDGDGEEPWLLPFDTPDGRWLRKLTDALAAIDRLDLVAFAPYVDVRKQVEVREGRKVVVLRDFTRAYGLFAVPLSSTNGCVIGADPARLSAAWDDPPIARLVATIGDGPSAVRFLEDPAAIPDRKNDDGSVRAFLHRPRDIPELSMRRAERLAATWARATDAKPLFVAGEELPKADRVWNAYRALPDSAELRRSRGRNEAEEVAEFLSAAGISPEPSKARTRSRLAGRSRAREKRRREFIRAYRENAQRALNSTRQEFAQADNPEFIVAREDAIEALRRRWMGARAAQAELEFQLGAHGLGERRSRERIAKEWSVSPKSMRIAGTGGLARSVEDLERDLDDLIRNLGK
jgi:hypothetical protein